MNILEFLQTYLHIDAVIVLIVIGSGFFQEKYLCAFSISKDSKYDAALKTLFLSAAISVIYLALVGIKKDAFAEYFLSYFLATSFYELILKPIIKMFRKNVEDEKNDKSTS